MKNLFLLFFPFLVFSQQTAQVDFIRIDATIAIQPKEKTVTGDVSVTFEVLEDVSGVYLDAIAMVPFDTTSQNDGTIEFTEDKIWFYGTFEKGYEYQRTFSYQATPKQALYFIENQVWTQGQGKYTSHWLPSIDAMNDKIEFDLRFITDANSTFISNGVLKERISFEERLIEVKERYPAVNVDSILVAMQKESTPKSIWDFDMKNPMSSYLVAFAAGAYKKKELTSQSGVPIELYYEPQDSLKVEPTYRHSKVIFDFLEQKIGVPYPWQNYKQVPVRDFLYAGMENTGCTLFSQAFVTDSIGFVDKNYVNVNAHELAHQWFGNYVTETSGDHHWLHEGFATYYALLAEKEIFGSDYYYWKLYQSAEQLKELSDVGKGQSLLDPKASSLTFYEKGAWALHILNERMGDEAFDTAVQLYLNSHPYKNVTTQDFVAAVSAVSEFDVNKWQKDWLEQSAFKATEAFQSLMQSDFMKSYFELSALRLQPLSQKIIPLTTELTFPNDYLGQEAVIQLAEEPFEQTIPLYKKGFESNNLLVRQAIAYTLSEIPTDLKVYYESLLADASYATKEIALRTLWTQFPEDRSAYLQRTEGVVGFQNKNIRHLWLALAIATPEFQDTNTVAYLNELAADTAPIHSFEIRQNAFEYINQLGVWNDTSLQNLIQAATHHYWRFRDAARNMLTAVLEERSWQKKVRDIYSSLSADERAYLKRIGFSAS